VRVALALALVAWPACGGPSSGARGPQTRQSATNRAAAPAESPGAVVGPAAAAGPSPGTSPVAVVAEHEAVTRVGLDVLEQGGNAIDAAIAATLTAGVVQPVSCGLGGGGFALVYDAKARSVVAIDFRAVAPIGLRPRHYVKPPPDEKRGVLVGVPGEVAGLYALHERWGTRAFGELAGRAAHVARDGFTLGAHMVRAMKWNARWLREAEPPWSAPEGGMRLGARVTNPPLASTLERLASEGRDAFYDGAIAQDIMATARASGSRVIPADLKKYQVAERVPLQVQWEGLDVVTLPFPSAGGLLVAETLRSHSAEDLRASGLATGATMHLLAETFRGAQADRLRFVGDPAFVKTQAEDLFSHARMKKRKARYAPDRTRTLEAFVTSDHGTCQVLAADAAGNVVAMTTTVGHMFGSKLLTPSGFVLNDALAAFTPAHETRRLGIARGPNTARGGARPVSSATPVLVLRDERPVLALSGVGGTKIPTAVTQVLLARLVYELSPSEAVTLPRFATPHSGGLLLDAGLSPDVAVDLRRRGEVVQTDRPNFSAVAMLARSEDGASWQVAVDPRKGGLAEVRFVTPPATEPVDSP